MYSKRKIIIELKIKIFSVSQTSVFSYESTEFLKSSSFPSSMLHQNLFRIFCMGFKLFLVFAIYYRVIASMYDFI